MTTNNGSVLCRSYFDYIFNQQWCARTELEPLLARRRAPNAVALDSEGADYKHAIRFMTMGAFNEGDAYTIATFANANFSIRQDENWRAFAPFWIRDEAQHGEAYFRMLEALGVYDRKEWLSLLTRESNKMSRHREDFYQKCPAFESPIAFWTALALDEWNTAREYAAAAKTTFAAVAEELQSVQAKLSRDEYKHHDYAVGALITSIQGARASESDVRRTIEVVREWAEENAAPVNTEQFMFDQEPVGGFRPDFSEAFQTVWKWVSESCKEQWG